MLLALLTGLRIEELGKLRSRNIRCDRDIWYIRVERERDRVLTAKAGSPSKTVKTDNPLRDVPVHWLLIEAGFLDFAGRNKEREAAWLFGELGQDKYGSRTKEASRRLIRWIRSLGITDAEKVFQSYVT